MYFSYYIICGYIITCIANFDRTPLLSIGMEEHVQSEEESGVYHPSIELARVNEEE
jgi:hypothetical protein